MSLTRFENEKNTSDGEEQAESNRRGSMLSSIGTFINNTKRGSLFQLDGKRGSIFQLDGEKGSKRGSPLLNDGKRGSIFLPDGKRGSIFQLDGEKGSKRGSPFQNPEYDGAKRGSIFQLFDDPYRGDEPRVLRLEEPQEQTEKKKKSVTFKELTRTETQLLRKRLLYKGEYRVLNSSVLFILSLIVFGIVFMSAWHYNNQNFWVLYLVLGLILGAAGLNIAAVKLYFHYKRYHGSGSSSKKGVTDMIIENLGFKDDSEEELSQNAVELSLKEIQKHDV